jgi:hypothetical protein
MKQQNTTQNRANAQEVNMELQYQNANGSWVDCATGDSHGAYGLIKNDDKNYLDRTDEFLKKSHDFVDNHPNRLALLTGRKRVYETIEDALSHGKSMATGSEWYNQIRQTPAPRVAPVIEYVKCSCGHSIPRGSVMSSSTGTSCPDCYDRMSM